MKTARIAQVCVALAVVLLFVASCGGDKPLTPEQMPYAGYWVAVDGSTINIRPTGAADCEIAGTKVTNGSITFEGASLTVGLMGIGKTLQITQAPTTLPDGRVTLGLDGLLYTRQ